MRHQVLLILFAAALGLSQPAAATYNATATGTVLTLQQDSSMDGSTAKTFSFNIANQPANSCPGGTFARFLVSPTTVPDTQTRKNMLAILLAAKLAGSQVVVGYDNGGGFCDQRMLGVYWIEII
jgi:hypothetical protein